MKIRRPGAQLSRSLVAPSQYNSPSLPPALSAIQAKTITRHGVRYMGKTASAPHKAAGSGAKTPQVKDQPLFIGGKFVDSRSNKTFPAINPATGETICQVPKATRPTSIAPSRLPARRSSGSLEKDGRRRTRPADVQAGRPHREECRASWPLSNRSTAARRSPIRAATCKASSTRSVITPAGPTRSKAAPFPSAATS